METMHIVVLEEAKDELAHHQRILATVPNVKLGLFTDPAAAHKFVVDNTIDVVVVDDEIAGGGIPFLKQVHGIAGARHSPAILLTANGDKEARRAAYEYGVYNCIEKPIDPPSYLCIARNALSMQVQRRNDVTNMTATHDQVKLLHAQVEEREVQVIYGLLHTANMVDPALSRRMAKVAGIASKIAHRLLSLKHDDPRRIGIAARVYDIGMLCIPHNLQERRHEMNALDAKRLLSPHTERAKEVFAKERTGLLEMAAIIAHQHHERFDGRGYPDGLAGGDISIYAQIVAVAEMYHDITTLGVPGAVNHTVLSDHQALAYIDRQSGTTFDPEVIEGLRLMVEAPIGDVPLAAKP